MIFRGLMDRSLGGFLCIRGYAPLGDIARVSHADMAYQRDLMREHSETVMRFLRHKQDLFFPEIVLSCVLDYRYEKGARSDVRPLEDVLAGKPFRSNVNGIRIAVKPLKYKTAGDVRATVASQLATLNVPDDLLPNASTNDFTRKELESRPKTPLFRIDGNHRLNAADMKQEFRDVLAPFCIILFGTGAEDKRTSKTIFHNINSKHIPLTREEIYKIVLDDSDLFLDATLKDSPSFGNHMLLARRTLPQLDSAAVPSLKGLLGEKRTMLVDLFQLLIAKKLLRTTAATAPTLEASLATVHTLYQQDSELTANRNPGLFQGFMYYALTDATDRRLGPFTQWVKGNHLAAMKTTDAHALIEIFDRVHTAKARTVFVSMQFGDDTDDTFESIKQSIEAVNTDLQPKIKIKPLRIDQLNKGHSYTITDAILTAIEDSGLLIADLTHANPNVYHEIGYMMGLNRGKGLKQENFILIANAKAKGNLDKSVGFNLRGVSQIRFNSFAALMKELTKRIKKYYGLEDA